MILKFLIGAAIVCFAFAVLGWIADRWSGFRRPFRAASDEIDRRAVAGTLIPQPEFEASPYTEKRHLQIVRDAPRQATPDEKVLLHEIHSQNCCTLYDQEKDK